MRRLALAGLLCGALNAVGAESVQTAAAPPLVSIERQGYAFEYPRVLAEQRLFGIAHGIGLLAEACAKEPLHAQSTGTAYRHWYEQQQLLIESLKNNLADFYFGPNASSANWKHVAAALNLRTRITPEAGSEQMAAACASLPEALQQPRYDLNALFQLEAALAATALAIRIDTQATTCLPRLQGRARDELQAAYANWQHTENAAAEQAQVQLLHYWQNTQASGTIDEWKKALAAPHARASSAVCTSLAARLGTPQASLAQSFAPAPVIWQDAEEAAPDHSVMAVSQSKPETALTTTRAADAPETTAPPSGQFDSLMKVFDERPYESRPARSQRAHP